MAILNILQYPDPRLRLIAKPVEHFDDKLATFISDMEETMRLNNGIGLAATQVNVQKRIFIMDVNQENKSSPPMTLINPVITKAYGQVESEEGCLSLLGIYETITRFEEIEVSFLNIAGVKQQLSCNGLMAICIQHEIDHLDGKVFIDYLSPLKQTFLKKKMKKRKIA